MKKPFFYCRVCLAFLLFCCLTSCVKTKAPVRNPVTPLQTLVNTDTTLSFFHRMVLQANEAGLLSDDPITVLIPTNDAFRYAGYSESLIDSLSASFADQLLRYHFISAHVIPGSDIYTGYPTLLQQHTVYGMVDGNHQNWFNGTKTIGDGVSVGNTLVYKLEVPLEPSEDSLNILLGKDSTLSLLAEVFRRTHLDSVLFSNNYTLLAPVNSAFAKAGYDSLPDIDNADSLTLVQLVKYHTLTATYFTNTFLGISSAPNLAGSSITVSNQGGYLQFSGAGNLVPANLVWGDQLAGNTLIVHRIDQVLSP